MANDSASTKKVFDSRKNNLRFYRSQKQTPPPSFLNNDTQEAKAEAQSLQPNSTDSIYTRSSPDKPLVIIMSKKSIFLFFFTVALVAILCFVAGFLVSYVSFGPKPAAVISEKTHKIGSSQPVSSQSVTEEQLTFFSLELASSDDLETAEQMVRQLKEQKLIPFLDTIKDQTGRTIYRISAGRYREYTTAHSALQKLPQPFSLWGKVIKIEHHVNQP